MEYIKDRKLEKRFTFIKYSVSNYPEVLEIFKESNLVPEKGAVILPSGEIIRLGDYVVLDGKKVIGGKKTKEDLLKTYKVIKKFSKADRSNFGYWFAHWCAYQMTALNLGVWRPRFLFHDIEKPWLKLFWNYKKVQKFHRIRNKHHMEYGVKHGFDKVDWIGLIVDYECSRYTKITQPLDTRQTIESMLKQEKWKQYESEIRKHIEPLIYRLGL